MKKLILCLMSTPFIYLSSLFAQDYGVIINSNMPVDNIDFAGKQQNQTVNENFNSMAGGPTSNGYYTQNNNNSAKEENISDDQAFTNLKTMMNKVQDNSATTELWNMQ